MLYLLGAIIIIIFNGTSLLASLLKVIPFHGVTVVSQMAAQVFGGRFMYYLLQFTTALILLLAANTAYNGLPILAGQTQRRGDGADAVPLQRE